MCLCIIIRKNVNFFASLSSLKKGVGSRVGSGAGSGSIGQRNGSEDPDPHQNVTGFHIYLCLLPVPSLGQYNSTAKRKRIHVLVFDKT
jgi:hypothetical protein